VRADSIPFSGQWIFELAEVCFQYSGILEVHFFQNYCLFYDFFEYSEQKPTALSIKYSMDSGFTMDAPSNNLRLFVQHRCDMQCVHFIYGRQGKLSILYEYKREILLFLLYFLSTIFPFSHVRCKQLAQCGTAHKSGFPGSRCMRQDISITDSQQTCEPL